MKGLIPKWIDLLVVALCASFITSPAWANTPEASGDERLVIIGMDGLTWNLLDPMIDAGELPNFKALLQRGQGSILESERPIRSPALWTTIATGQPRSTHGIYDFVTGTTYWPKDQRAKTKKLMTSDMRKSPALWNLASHHHKESLVVGWLNTWPAEPVEGTIIAPYVALGQHKQISIKGKIYRDERGQTWPEERFDEVKSLIVSTKDITQAQLKLLANPPKSPRAPLYKQIPMLKRSVDAMKWSLASTYTNLNILEHELKNRPNSQLVMTYFDGSDTLAHRFWHLRQPVKTIARRLKAHGMPPRAAKNLKARFGKVVEGYYKILDEGLGRIIAAAGPNATIMIVSDHGIGTQKTRRSLHKHVPFDAKHILDGVMLVAGPDIQNTPIRSNATIYDVAPTALYLMGLPVPNMPGTIRTELVSPAYVMRHPPTMVATSVPDMPLEQPDLANYFEDKEVERLRSLGYVN